MRKIKMVLCSALAVTVVLSGCGDTGAVEKTGESGTQAAETTVEAAVTSKAMKSEENETEENGKEEAAYQVQTDLKPSEGLLFESREDGTCVLTGIGICTDTELVIPAYSPDGERVALVEENAFMSLEDVNSVTFLNFEGEIDKRAFQYGEMTEVRFIGGAPVVGESVFSSCEDLVAVSFEDCSLQVNEHSFLSAGKNMEVSFLRCSGLLDDRAFQYADLAKLFVAESELEMGESVFSSCEDLLNMDFSDSSIVAGEHTFMGSGDEAVVQMTGCSVKLDDRVFQYASLSSLSVKDSTLETGDSTFSSCEDLATVVLDGDSIILGENAFLSCEDLVDVKICEERDGSKVEIDDRAFQYCEKLESVAIGGDEVRIGEYAFGESAENLSVSVQGKEYRAKNLEKGYE